MRVGALLKDCLAGKSLSKDEALFLARVQGDDLTELLAAAAVLRDRRAGKTITFSPKVFIPLTNLCRDFCGYCAFRKAPGEAGAKTMTEDEVLETARSARALGCTEALFSLGDRPEAIYPEMSAFLATRGLRRTLDYLYESCAAVLAETGLLPHSNPGLMGQRDLERLRSVNVSLGLMLESASERLLLPGGAHARAPDKKPTLRLRTIELAGRLKIPFTTGILIGVGENWEERIDSLFAIAELHRHYGHVQEVIVQNFRAKAAIPMRDHPEPSFATLRKTVALARLIFGDAMNIQTPPNLSPETYPALIHAGINDWGGVSPLTPDYINAEAAWPELATLEEKTKAAGFVLKARLPIYPEYIARLDEFVSPSLRPHVERLQGPDGLLRKEKTESLLAPRSARVEPLAAHG